MKNLKNEKGAALVLSLLIITLILLFILTLFYQVSNTTKQVSTTRKHIDAQLIAEMGIEYYYQKIGNQYEDSSSDLEDIIDEIKNEAKNGKGEFQGIQVDNNRAFKLIELEIDDSDPNKINIKCMGKAFGRETVEKNEIGPPEN